MKKIMRLTESDLVRIVKRVINEQSGTSGHSTFYILKKEFEPSGFKFNKYNESLMDLANGDDMNGAYITYDNNSNNTRIRWGVVSNGKSLIDKEMILNGTNDAKILDSVRKDLGKYKNYKFKKTPYQG